MAHTYTENVLTMAVAMVPITLLVFALYLALRTLQVLAQWVMCWWRGYTPVSMRTEVVSSRLLAALGDDHDEECLERVERNGVFSHSRVRRRTPYIVSVVRELRGGELGQVTLSKANQLVVDRHARAIAKRDGVRPQDFARMLPMINTMYFYCPSEEQIEAEEAKHSGAFVSQSVRADADYSGQSGRNHRKVVA
jgi:hypothetical protein